MEVLNITSVVCLRQTCIVTGHSASHVKVVTSLCKWSSMHKYGINENGQTIMQLYTIDMSNHHPMDLSQGHGDRHPQPHPDPLHAGVMAHPEPPGPLHRDRGTLPVLTKQQQLLSVIGTCGNTPVIMHKSQQMKTNKMFKHLYIC